MISEFADSVLPGALREVDISAFADLEPRDLIVHPERLIADALAASRALVYARAASQRMYDSIGFRMFAASPRRGQTPLQTSAWTTMQREVTQRQRGSTEIDEVLNQQPKLRHRPLELPKETGRYDYTIDRDLIHFFLRRADSADREVVDRWTFSLTDPPEAMLLGAADRDEPLIAASQLHVQLEGTHWLPFPVLLAEGCFRRLQDFRSRLVRATRPGAFYCFLSHRWLDPSHPDPDALQAQFAAWQLIAHLTEAVRVAAQRGLHQPRRFSQQLGTTVGPRGSELAEALIVNVLRGTLDEETLRRAAAEILPLETVLEDYGVAKASRDVGLAELNSLLADRPAVRGLTDSIYIWYDYSCLPQPPRDGSDVDLFVKGLEELSAAQILGRTAIMLDDADDYLSRAWCTLEALVADTSGGATDLIVGSARPTAAKGEVEHYFENLLADRPHVIWRAVLDTELFGIQSRETCMTRLGLAVTDPNDLPFIYDRLRSLAAPNKIHIDDSELVTGTFPVPSFENGAIGVRARGDGRAYLPHEEPPQLTTLNWSDALWLTKAWDSGRDSVATIPPFRAIHDTPGGDAPSCHIAVIGACEGEAMLLANWAHLRRADVESLLGVAVASVSWLATDIAPIGHLVLGTLQAVPVMADTWVVVAVSTRLQHCKVTGLITETLKWAGVPHATVAVDKHRNNVEIPPKVDPPKSVDLADLIVVVDLTTNPPRTHAGGLFQWQLQDELL